MPSLNGPTFRPFGSERCSFSNQRTSRAWQLFQSQRAAPAPNPQPLTSEERPSPRPLFGRGELVTPGDETLEFAPVDAAVQPSADIDLAAVRRAEEVLLPHQAFDVHRRRFQRYRRTPAQDLERAERPAGNTKVR